ncbi:MAG: DOPA 4,5-dioxygenase family protein [Dongiaceae bacterium]
MPDPTTPRAPIEPSAIRGNHTPAAIRGYHAHVYFGPGTVAEARALYDRIPAALPDAALGRFHERPVGPHPAWSYQIAFDAAAYGRIVPWLATQRGTLDVFVHGLSGDDLYDHTALAMWLGRSYTLDLSVL